MSRETSSGYATVRQLCKAFSLSRQAFYAARQACQRRPSEAASTSRRGGVCVAELEPKIRALAQAHPAWGVRKVWACLRRDGVCVSQKRVWALMKAWGLVLAPAGVGERGELRGHVAVPESNRRWATDLTTVWTSQDGLAAVTLVVDCGDRVVLAGEATKSQQSGAVLAPVRRSLQSEFGHPLRVCEGLELRSDHGPQYTGGDCEALCRTWRLEHTFAPVGRPTGNAVVERLILTLKQELIWPRDWTSIVELQQALQTWIDTYNNQRPHQALDWLTPAEKRDNNLGRSLKKAA
jgi:putative transposase